MGFITAILKRPSVRTQLEASLTGIVTLLMGSFGTFIYLVFFTDMNGWLKFLTTLGEIGIFLLMGSSLAGTYMQYYIFKKSMGLYPKDELLEVKIFEAKQVINELNELIESESPAKNICNEIKPMEVKNGNL